MSFKFEKSVLKSHRFEDKSCPLVWLFGDLHFCISCLMAAGWTGCGSGEFCLLRSFGLCATTSPHQYDWSLMDGYQWCSGWFLIQSCRSFLLCVSHVCDVFSQDDFHHVYFHNWGKSWWENPVTNANKRKWNNHFNMNVMSQVVIIIIQNLYWETKDGPLTKCYPF